MKKKFISAFIALTMLMMVSCTDETNSGEKSIARNQMENEFGRLCFNSASELENVINEGNEDEGNIVPMVMTRAGQNFVSLLSKTNKKNTRGADDSSETYYEALGYDSLVPNKAFAALLNLNGEIQVKDTIYRINHNGTYFYNVKDANKFNEICKQDSLGTFCGNNLYKLSDGIFLYKTFCDTINNQEYNDESSMNDDSVGRTRSEYSSVNPDLSNFDTVDPSKQKNLKNLWGLLGSNKWYTSKHSKHRRISTRLYSYDYVIYHEAGISAKGEKKNFIGWSKTEADEIRIGIDYVVLKMDFKNYWLEDVKRNASHFNMNINGINDVGTYNAYSPQYGNRTVCSFFIFDKEFDITNKDWQNAIEHVFKTKILNAFVSRPIDMISVSSPNCTYIVISKENYKEYNVKSMTHVFTKGMFENCNLDFTISFNGNFNMDWEHSLKETYNNHHQWKFEQAKAYSAVAFGTDNWRGFNFIVKK